VPIQQAGMGGVATAELASAVALAGALGMIGGVRLGANVLGEELDSLPRQTRSRIKPNGYFWMERIRYSVFLKLDFVKLLIRLTMILFLPCLV